MNRIHSEQFGSSDEEDAQLMMDDGGVENREKKEAEGDDDIMETEQTENKDKDTNNHDKLSTKSTEMESELKRKIEALGNMEKIEKEFADLKEKFFKDKISQLKREIDSINHDTHPTFREKCRELEDIKSDKIWNAEQWKQYQLQNINNVFEAERRQAEEEYSAEKQQLKEKMINAIYDKQKKLTEEKMTMNLTDASDSRTNTRTLRKRGGVSTQQQQNNFKKKLNHINTAPNINYTLRDFEILEDLSIIVNTKPTRSGGR